MSSVCQNQNSFNSAVYDAVKYTVKQDKPNKWLMLVFFVLYVILTLVAVFLAVREKSNRQLHILFALLFGPLYIIAHLLSM